MDRSDDEVMLNGSTVESEEHVSESNAFDFTSSKDDLLAFNKLDDKKLLSKEEEPAEQEPEEEPAEQEPEELVESENESKGEAEESKKETSKVRKKKRHPTETIQDAKTDDPDALRDAEERRKRQIKTGIAIATTVFSVSTAIYVAFFRGDSTPKFEPPPPAKPTPAKPVVQAPKEEPPPPPPQVAPMPRPYRPTNRFAAAAFFLERNADPTAFDKLYGGTYLVIHGAYARSVNGVITLTENPDDVEGIVCTPPKLALNESQIDLSALNTGQIPAGTTLTVRGILSAPLTTATFTTATPSLIDFEVLNAGSPGDDEYRNKDIELAGIVAQVSPESDGGRIPSLNLEPSSTDCPVSIRCLFDGSERERLAKIRAGQAVLVRGHCEGRLGRTVRFSNCMIVDDPTARADANFLHISSDRLFTAYERDLLPAPRPGRDVEVISVAVDQLVSAFTTNLKQANNNYRFRPVRLRAKVVERRPATRSIILESKTGDRYQVLAVFNAQHYSALLNEQEVLIRGVCVGVRDVKFIRIENAELMNVEPRLTADYLPLEPGRELLYDSLTPLKLKGDNVVTQLKVRVSETDLITSTAIRSGTYAANTLFTNFPVQPHWLKDLTKQKVPPVTVVTQFRINNDTVEIRAIPAPPLQPSQWWDPVLKFGSKKGDSWSSEAPDGRTITYTVMDFRKDDYQRQLVVVRRVAKNSKDQSQWEESLIIYARGVGEIRRILSKQSAGVGVTMLETRYVESGLEGVVELRGGAKSEPDKKEPEKKDKKD